MTLAAVDGKPLPVYGTGENIRDWLHVTDHARALWMIATTGRVNETYMVGGRSEFTNLAIVKSICDHLDGKVERPGGGSHHDLITFVEDRPGHDFRYAVDDQKLRSELGWTPQYDLARGLPETVDWYLDNAWWWERIRAGNYQGERLGGIKPAKS